MSSAAASPATRAIDLELAPHAVLDPGAPLVGPLGRERTAAAQGKLFYGWIMVPLATLVMVCSAPGQTYGFMFFNPWLRRSLALSQTELSATYLLATLCAAAPLSYLGGLSDRVGLKRSLLAAVSAMAGACLLASMVRSTAMLFVACLGLRLVGAGLMSLLATNTLAAWFDRRLPLACGIMQFSMAASMALVPVGLMTLIDAVGWRGAYGCLGIALAAVLLPLVAVVYRERPSDLGQRRDGDASATSGSSSSARAALPATAWRIVDDDHPPSLNLAAALRTRMFWMLLISTGVWSLIGTGLMFHLESLLRAHDLGSPQIAWATPLMAISMAVLQLASSVLIDLVAIRRLIGGALICTATSCTMLATGGGWAALAAYSVYGVGQGLMTVVSSASWAQYFGPAHLGRIRGTSMTVGISCSALGPLVMGASVDALGGFEPSLWLFASLAALVAVGSAALGQE